MPHENSRDSHLERSPQFPFDLSDRKPKAIRDVDALEKQCDQLKGLDVHALECELRRVVSILPNYDDDDITVAIFPGDPDNAIVNERQNGVVGTSLFGSILIQVNPLISGYDAWIPYVFAHEYHHTVWATTGSCCTAENWKTS